MDDSERFDWKKDDNSAVVYESTEGIAVYGNQRGGVTIRLAHWGSPWMSKRQIKSDARRPSYQFYPHDWLSDIGLQSCSLAAQGLWIRMNCYMHQGHPYGYLTFAPKDGDKDILTPILRPMQPAVLARMVGADLATVSELLQELEDAGVFSRTPENVIFSRRMVRDEEVRQARANGGVKSLENPNVPRPKQKLKDIQEGYPSYGPYVGSLDGSFGGSPSSSSSSSSSSSEDLEGESSGNGSIVEFSLDGAPACSLPKDDLVAPLVEAGWRYFLERTGRHADQYKLTRERQVMGRRGFESLIQFAKHRKVENPHDIAVELFRLAVDRLVSSPFHAGKNDQGRQYLDWHQLFMGKGHPSPRKLLEFWLEDSRWPE